tara:strand:- start:409 stop:1557 length:1149 start_codon:yes stop_codon:yes gene_type:complete
MTQADSKNSSGQERQQTAQTVPYPSPYHQHFEEDTFDLYELWLTLWKRKWLVIAVTVVAALGSIVHALQLQRIYKAEALLLPPKTKDVQLLNVLGIQQTIDGSRISNLSFYSAETVFGKFKQNLKSRTLHKKFIQVKGLMEILAPNRTAKTNEDIYQGFAEMIKLGEETGTSSLSIEMYDAKIAAQWINDLIEFINKETIALLVEDLQNSIANQIRNIEYAIGSKRHMAKQRREDKILRYKEASIIAMQLDIADRIDSTNVVQNNRFNISTTNIPLYYRGYRALNTEIEYLNNRKSDDPFIPGLRDLHEQLTLLRSIEFDQEKMNAVYVDRAAYPTNSHIKPNRRLIVSLATVVGLFSGIFLAFFTEFVQNQRKKHQSNSPP